MCILAALKRSSHLSDFLLNFVRVVSLETESPVLYILWILSTSFLLFPFLISSLLIITISALFSNLLTLDHQVRGVL